MAMKDLIFRIRSNFDDSGTDAARRGLRGVESAGIKAGNAIDRLGKEAVGTARVALGNLGADLISGVGRAMIDFAANTFASADQIGKLATATGLSTLELQRMKLAAEFGGVSLEDMSKGSVRLSRAINEARQGVATYTDSFDQLGVSLDDLGGDTSSQLQTVGLALSAVTDDTERAALAQELLGRAGLELLPVFADNAAAITRANETITENNALTEDQIRNAETVNDALAELRSEAVVALQSALLELAPAMIAISENMDTIITVTGVAHDVVQGLTNPLGLAREKWQDLFGAQEEYNRSSGRAVQGLGALRVEVEAVPSVTNAAGQALESFTADTEAATAATNKWKAELYETSAAARAATDDIARLAIAARDLDAAVLDQAAAITGNQDLSLVQHRRDSGTSRSSSNNNPASLPPGAEVIG